MNRRAPLIGAALATGIAVSALGILRFSRAQTLSTPPKYLLTAKNLVLLSAPQVVAGPIVLNAKWSPDGVRVAAIRSTERTVLEDTVHELRLVIWSAGRQSHELWRGDMAPETVPHIAWITPEVVTVEIKWQERVQGADANGRPTSVMMPRQTVLWVDAARDQVKTIPEMPGDHLYVSPSRPFAALLSPNQHRISLLKPDGNTLKTTPLPDKTTWQQFHGENNWAEDGVHVLLDALDAVPASPESALRSYGLNVQTGELQRDWTETPSVHKAPATELHLTRTIQEVKLGRRTHLLHPLWLESSTGGEQPAALLAPDSDAGKISPLGTSVLYLSDRAALVTPLRIGPKEPFLSALKARLQANAKQLGLAMRMYAADYDEALPLPDAGLQDALEPYHKNNAIYEGFNYTFPGGALPAASQLGSTQLGAVEGPGGQWIIFGDGRVTWKPN